MDVSSLLWGGPAFLVVAWMVGVYLFSRLVLNPKRHTAWSDPRAELGLDFEAVRFPARDGLMIEGWFIPGPHQTEGPAAIIMHGWPWNRMGTPANRLLWDLPGSTPVRLMPPLAGRLHSEERFGGYMELVDRPEPIIDFFAPLRSPTPATAGQEAVAH